jgi:hypothetical protein
MLLLGNAPAGRNRLCPGEACCHKKACLKRNSTKSTAESSKPNSVELLGAYKAAASKSCHSGSTMQMFSFRKSATCGRKNSALSRLQKNCHISFISHRYLRQIRSQETQAKNCTMEQLNKLII